jgi:hypothetical protein
MKQFKKIPAICRSWPGAFLWRCSNTFAAAYST